MLKENITENIARVNKLKEDYRRTVEEEILPMEEGDCDRLM